MRVYEYKSALKSLITLVVTLFLVVSFNNCAKSSGNDNETPTAPVTPPPNNSAQSHECGGSNFSSDHFIMDTSIDGQNGWYVDHSANFDERVVNIGTAACRGQGVWRINNTVTSSAFGNQPQSPAFVKSSGESSVRSAGAGDSMLVSFFIRTVAAAGDGSVMTLSLSPTIADRHTYLRFVNDSDANNGFRIYALDGINLDQEHVIGQLMSRGVWHHIKIVNTNPDGGNNDVVQVYVNGALTSTHSTWEDWRTALPATTLAVNRMLFRMNASATSINPSFTAPAGFYIDDYVQTSFNSSSPSVAIESYSTGFEP